MKIVMTILTLMVCLSVGVCFAGNESRGINVKAEVPPLFQLDIWVRAINAANAPKEPNLMNPYDPSYSSKCGERNAPEELNFGTFDIVPTPGKAIFKGKEIDVVYDVWVPKQYFCVFLSAKTQGTAYKINQLCIAPDVIKKTLLLTTDYCAEDLLGKLPQGELAGAKVVNEKKKQFADTGEAFNIFESNVTGETKIMRCWYSFAQGEDDEPANAILLNELPAGSLSGSITYTLVRN